MLSNCLSLHKPTSETVWRMFAYTPLMHIFITYAPAPDVLVGTLHGSYHHKFMDVRMVYCKSLWTKASAKYKM